MTGTFLINCQECGGALVQPLRGRRRKYCYECAAARGRARVTAWKAARTQVIACRKCGERVPTRVGRTPDTCDKCAGRRPRPARGPGKCACGAPVASAGRLCGKCVHERRHAYAREYYRK